MKFTADKERIRNVVSAAMEVSGNSNAASISSYLRLEVDDGILDIRAFGSGMRFKTTFPVEDADNGVTIVYCNKLLSILGSLPEGAINFSKEPDSNETVVKPVGKRITFRLKSMTGEKFPDMPMDKEDMKWVSLPAAEFINGSLSVSKAACEDSTRLFMMGVHIEPAETGVNFIATDGKRLSFNHSGTEKVEFKDITVPTKILGLVGKYGSKQGDVQLSITENEIFIKTGDFLFASSVITLPYPAYKKVIPDKQDNVMNVDSDELLKSLRRIRVMTEKKTGKVILNIKKDAIVLEGSTEDGKASEELSVESTAEMTLALNTQFLIDALDNVPAGKIKVEFSGEMKPVTIKTDSEKGLFHLIMPMQKN